MHGILSPNLVTALDALGIVVPAASNALPALTQAARRHDLSLRIERGAIAHRQASPAYRAIVWPSVCGRRESLAAQRLIARGHGATGAEALAHALLEALRAQYAARARELARV